MPIFKIQHRKSSLGMIVRARCLSCARIVAAESAGEEGPIVWRNPELSSVELVQDTGKNQIILKTESHE